MKINVMNENSNEERVIGKENTKVKKVIFACVHNAGRSQMAAAFFNQYADPLKAVALSAGTEPAGHVHPEVRDRIKSLVLNLVITNEWGKANCDRSFK